MLLQFGVKKDLHNGWLTGTIDSESRVWWKSTLNIDQLTNFWYADGLKFKMINEPVSIPFNLLTYLPVV